MPKLVIINRAIPGSGKTTLTKNIKETLENHGYSVAIHSTDEFFMEGERYAFELEKLGAYHQENQEQFVKSLE
ncbi:hypothetical protein NHP200010_16140 [Helicobacter bizzozeronii]|uniref:nucleoside-triphosphatase n=1 Tax=Helicobacter bizzozeronii TaxID=56877 RepID=UPI00244D9001|nr:nucleoside-triphosphatase [Helicobacter bizzozeronii]GMB93879.1 hypothetical protein NHP200010_16140 [Helicobacter bizzozeronii]